MEVSARSISSFVPKSFLMTSFFISMVKDLFDKVSITSEGIGAT